MAPDIQAKRRGRPRECDEPMHPVTTRLPESLSDSVQQIALHRGASVHQVMRDAVRYFVATNRQERPARSS